MQDDDIQKRQVLEDTLRSTNTYPLPKAVFRVCRTKFPHLAAGSRLKLRWVNALERRRSEASVFGGAEKLVNLKSLNVWSCL